MLYLYLPANVYISVSSQMRENQGAFLFKVGEYLLGQNIEQKKGA